MAQSGSAPLAPAIDSTAAFLQEGYTFAGHRRRQLGSDIFFLRLAGEPVTCLVGEDAARALVVPGRMADAVLLPPDTTAVLEMLGRLSRGAAGDDTPQGTVLGWMPDERVDVAAAVDAEWQATLQEWRQRPAVVLFDELPALTARVVERLRAGGAWVGPFVASTAGLQAAFAALALHQHASARVRLQGHSRDYLRYFAQEVCRFYPVSPGVAARVGDPFVWRGHRFSPGSVLLFDLPSSNRDPRSWPNAEQFRPERFNDRDGDALAWLVRETPEAARAYETWLDMLEAHVRQLVRLHYGVPHQDLRVDVHTMPARPGSGLRVVDIERRRARRLAGEPPNVHTEDRE